MAIPYGDAGSPGGGGRHLPRPAINRARQHINHTFGRQARRAMGGMGQGGGNGQGSQPAPGETGANPYDYSSDPLLQRIRAAGTERIGQGEAEALRQRKQLLIDYGDADLARSLGMDQNTIDAATNNAFSTKARLAKEAVDRPVSLDNALNRGNLFYSGARGVQQSNLAQALLGEQNDAYQRAQGGLNDINNNLMDIRNQVNEANMNAEQDAADRLQQQLGELPMGGAPGGGSHGGPFGGAVPRAGINTNRLAQMLRPRGGHHAIPHLPGRRP